MKSLVVALHESLEANPLSIESYDTCYHWTTQGKLMDMCFVDDIRSPTNSKEFYSKLRKRFVIDLQYNNTPQICFTVDKDMPDAAFNDSIVRLTFDLKRMLSDFGIVKFENHLTNKEAEIRLISKFENWHKYCKLIEIEKEVYEEGEEFEDIIIDPIKAWLPSELKSITKSLSKMPGKSGETLRHKLAKLK